MDFDEFQQFLASGTPPARMSRLLQALWHDGAGEWARAHEIVQTQQGRTAAAIHAYLHRKEGDLSNADYWYGRAGSGRPRSSLEKEWRALVEALLDKKGK